jgi:diacylglycerol kinase (ATP)
MVFELMNIAIESVCNLVSPGFHPLVKIAKDAGSAAVFLAMLPNYILWIYLAYAYW